MARAFTMYHSKLVQLTFNSFWHIIPVVVSMLQTSWVEYVAWKDYVENWQTYHLYHGMPTGSLYSKSVEKFFFSFSVSVQRNYLLTFDLPFCFYLVETLNLKDKDAFVLS